MEDFQHYLKLINNCDPSDPLLSTTSLGERLKQIPLRMVNKSDLSSMTQALNSEQLIPTEAGLARDYRGLAELMGFSTIDIENCIRRSYNPTRSLIDAFINSKNDVTLNDLLKLIEGIERFDVIDDVMPTLIKLASSMINQVQVPIKNDHQAPSSNISEGTGVSLVATNHEVRNFSRLTIDDTPHSAVIIYDAFICYAPEDIEYAKELIDLLEANNKTVATADDLLPGNFEHDSLIRLIDNRCRKVVIILTPNFSRSKECEFQTKFASEIGIKADSPKIIPVLYEACNDSLLPSMIKVLSKIDMTNQANRQWQLHRLIRSLSEDYELTNTRRSFSRLLNNPTTYGTNGRQVTNTSGSPSYDQTHNDHPIPAITLSSNLQNTAQSSSSSRSPIVDIMQSKSSGELELRQTSRFDSTQPVTHMKIPSSMASSSKNPINWFKKLYRNDPNSTTSQSILITSDYNDEKYQQPNG